MTEITSYTQGIWRGDALDLIESISPKSQDLIVTDPPYAFGGSGVEHAISATVAVVLRESARRLKTGGWMLVMCASSWRSQSYMVEAVRGIVEPVRVGTWVKKGGTTKVKTPGWSWSTAKVIAFRRGKSGDIQPAGTPDYIEAPIIRRGRRAQGNATRRHDGKGV